EEDPARPHPRAPRRRRRSGRRAGRPQPGDALRGRPDEPPADGGPVALPPRSRQRRAGPELPAPGRHRRVERDDDPQRVERRGRVARVDARHDRLVPQGLQAAVGQEPVRLHAALRVGQLPLARVDQRQADRHEPRRVHPVRAADPALGAEPQRHEPARHPRRERPQALRPPAVGLHAHLGADRRLVELRRHAPRGLPAADRPRRLQHRPGAARPAVPHLRRDDALPRHRPQRLQQGSEGAPDRAVRQPSRPLQALLGRCRPLRHVHRERPRRPAEAVVAQGAEPLQRPPRPARRRRPRRLVQAQERHPLGEGHRRQAPPQRAAGEHPRRQHPRGRPQARLRDQQPDPRELRQRGEGRRRDDAALALPAAPVHARARRPPGHAHLVRDPDVRDQDAIPEVRDRPQDGRERAAREHPRQRQPPVGRDVVGRQRAVLAARPGPGRLPAPRHTAGEGARPDAPGLLRGRRLPGGGLPDRVRAARHPRHQRVLRLVPRPERPDRRPHGAQRVPRRRALLLSEQGDHDHRVRRRGEPQRPGRGEGHVRVPAGLRELPPRRVQHEALAERCPLLDAQGVPRPARVGRREPAPAGADPPEGRHQLRRRAQARVHRSPAQLPEHRPVPGRRRAAGPAAARSRARI
ncbi:MAG: GH2, partial [uncultured Solirubrobacteraceae bacterium]